MKKTKTLIFLPVLLALLALVFAGCDSSGGDGGDDGDGDFIAVTGIAGVPVSAAVGIPVTLTGTVQPANATSKTIVWSLQEAGVTSASFGADTFNTSATGTMVVRAVVAGGTSEGVDYIQDFSIDVISLPAYSMISVPGGTVSSNVAYIGSADTNGPFVNAGTTPVSVSAFKIGETEITYALWRAVFDWAINGARGARKYTFAANTGKEGNDGVAGAAASATEPVTTISTRDMLVWCNAYSEATGKTPAFYLEGTADFSDAAQVVRETEPINGGGSQSAGNGKIEKAVVNPQADGFRLPTEAQWEYAARGGNPLDSTNWNYAYAGSDTASDVAVCSASGTANVKTKTPNSLGLYDMSGNINEFCFDIVATTQRQRRGGAYSHTDDNLKVNYRDSNTLTGTSPAQGFRVVCP